MVHPLPASRYVYRESKSTKSALYHLMDTVEVRLETKGYIVGIFLHIEGAFIGMD